MIVSGCQGRKILVVIPSDKEISLLRAGQTLTASNDVWLVPPARMQEIMHRLYE